MLTEMLDTASTYSNNPLGLRRDDIESRTPDTPVLNRGPYIEFVSPNPQFISPASP
jgi:hypothetical protein